MARSRPEDDSPHQAREVRTPTVERGEDPERGRPLQRLIISSDAKNEADDQFALVHALLSPTLAVEGLIAAHFGRPGSVHQSRAEIELLLDLMGPDCVVPVLEGATAALVDEATSAHSAGCRFIVERATASIDRRPLFIACLGPLTDLASALLVCPEIAHTNVTVVWIGGHPYGDANEPRSDPEFNLGNDIAAANVVFGSGIRIWQIPSDVYQMVGVGYAELEQKVAGRGRIGTYLVAQLKRWNLENVPWAVEYRSLGDSPAIGVILNPLGAVWREYDAPHFGADGSRSGLIASRHKVRVCQAVDSRFLLEDFFAKVGQFGPED